MAPKGPNYNKLGIAKKEAAKPGLAASFFAMPLGT